MRTLLLMRHAKSCWKDPSLEDADRPLSPRGKRAAAQMGRFLAEHGLLPEAVVCSTAKRARQTAKRVKKSADCDARTAKSAALYFNGPDAYLRAAAQLPDHVATALMVGHNPDLELLVARLSGECIPIPTGTIVHLTACVPGWNHVADGGPLKVVGVYRPKELAAGPNRRRTARRPRRRRIS